MTSDVFMIRNGDGVDVGPCSAQTIAVLISEGVITPDAYVISAHGLVPITQVPNFAKAIGRVDERPHALSPLVLFTGDLGGDDGALPIEPGDLHEPVEISMAPSVDLPAATGTFEELLGEEHEVIDPWFAGVLAELWRRRQTAILEVEAADVRTTIFLLEGTPMFASNGTLTDTLGRLLIRMGRITEDQLEKAIEHYIDHYEGTNKRVGEVLIELGFVTPDQISEALHIQTREKILSCFQWTELRYRLREDDELVKKMPRFGCPVPALLEEGIRRFYDDDRADLVLRTLTVKYPGISRSQIGDALAGELPEDQELDLPEGDDDAALADAFDVPPKETGISAVRALWAEASFKAGKRLARQKPGVALAKLRRAVHLRPEALEYRAMLAYLEYQVAQSDAERDAKESEARSFAEQALMQDRKSGSAHTILGQFEKQSGNTASALEHFRRALELDASDPEATHEFRSLRQPHAGA